MQEDKGKYLFWLKIMVTAALLVLAVIKFDWICLIVKEAYGMLLPFLAGGLIAFILNIPMRSIEKRLFSKAKSNFWTKAKRPISIVLTILLLFVVLTLLFVLVIPQIAETCKGLPEQITAFYFKTLEQIEQFMSQNPQIMAVFMEEVEKLKEIKIDWQKVITAVTDFFMNGFGGSFIKNTFSVAGKIGSGVVNAVIAVIFSIYLLIMKERLKNQGKRILSAILKKESYEKAMKAITLLANNFSNFIAGQCVEAVILGLLIMFSMMIFRLDYALLIGVLVGFTSLIPIVGAFIGCGVGAFLFLIQDPRQALLFVILFLVIQQIEGNLIYPYVVGNSVGLPSIWILAAISIGGSLMGVAGMLFFIPLFSTFYTLFRDGVNERNGAKEWVKEAWDTDYLPLSEAEKQKKGIAGIISNIFHTRKLKKEENQKKPASQPVSKPVVKNNTSGNKNAKKRRK